MFIKDIKLKDFRNYESLNLKFHNRVNIILGNNAQGKTNLIESIYVTSFGKSFRTSKETDLIFFEKDFCKIELNAEKDEENLNIEIVVSKNGKSGKIDGVKIKKAGDILENIYTVIFSPEDLKIVKEEPEKRRKFMDREICQFKKSYYTNLHNYKRVLKHRNMLLKDIKAGNIAYNQSGIDIWDDRLCFYGVKVMEERKVFVEKLCEISNKTHKGITDGAENLNVTYEPNVDIWKNEEAKEIFFKKQLKANIDRDIKNCTTSKGPHKDDINVEIDGIDIRTFGSQGQQRTAALSLKLSEISLLKEETGENPILLLDDVMSELDSKRQHFLIKNLIDTQIFITTTELSAEVEKSLPSGKTFYVTKGTIVEKN